MRRRFGGTAATVLIDAVGANANAVVTAFSAATGGTQFIDLRTLDDQPIPFGNLQADALGAVPEFLGPDDGRSELYLYAGVGSTRYLVQANDIPSRLAALEGAAGGVVVYDGGGA